MVRYDVGTGSFVDVFARGGGLPGPNALTFGTGGDLFVSSESGDDVLRHDGTTGAFLGTFTQGRGLDGPIGLALAPQVVPEPAIALLLGDGLLGSVWWRRPRRA